MQFERPNIDINQKIDAYIKGQLSEAEIQELWTVLLKHPKYIDRLQTEIDLTRYHRQNGKKQHIIKRYWGWFAAAAAIVILAVGLNLFFNDSIDRYAIEQISLRDNLATASVMRSGKLSYGTADSLLNLGFKNAINGKIDKALAIYKKVIVNYSHTSYAAKAFLNEGIINYNQEKYEEAVTHFEKALPIIEQNHYMLEQVYWYLGNALINTDEYARAEKMLKKTYQLNGIHAERASKLLNELNQERGNK